MVHLDNEMTMDPTEDREWLDKRSTKKIFRFSEQNKIEELYIQIFGKLPESNNS